MARKFSEADFADSVPSAQEGPRIFSEDDFQDSVAADIDVPESGAPAEGSMLERLGLPSPIGALRRLSGIDAARSLGQLGAGAAENMQADQDVIRSAFEQHKIPGANLTTPVIASEIMEFVTPKSALEVYTLLPTGPGLVDDIGRLAAKAVPAAVARKTSAAGRALLALAERHGVPLSAADIADSKMVSSFENWMEKTPLGSGVINEFRDKQLTALRALRDRVAGRLGTAESKEAAGLIFKEALKEASQASNAQGEILYASVAEKAAGKSVKMSSLSKNADMLIKRELAKRPEDANQSIVALAREVLDREADPSFPLVGSGSEELSFDFAQMAGKRMKYNGIIALEDASVAAGQMGQKGLSTPYGGAAKLLKRAMREDLAAFAKAEGGDVADAYNLANSFWGEHKDKFANKTIKELTKRDPEKVAAFVFRPGNISEIRRAKSAVGPEAFGKLRETFVSDLMSKLPDEKFSPGAINRELAKFGDETLKEIFSPAELADIHDLGTLSQAAQRANSLSGTFGSARSNTMTASFGGVLLAAQHLAGLPTAVGILIGPRVVANMYLSEMGRKLLIAGFSTPGNGEAGVRLMARTAAFLGPKIPKAVRDASEQIERGERQRSEPKARRDPEPERRESRSEPRSEPREPQEPAKRPRTIRERAERKPERKPRRKPAKAAQTAAAMTIIEQDEAQQQRIREGT